MVGWRGGGVDGGGVHVFFFTMVCKMSHEGGGGGGGQIKFTYNIRGLPKIVRGKGIFPLT